MILLKYTIRIIVQIIVKDHTYSKKCKKHWHVLDHRQFFNDLRLARERTEGWEIRRP
jgi:hypothetical protein